MPGWGVGPWGVGPWGLGALLEVLDAVPIAENRIRVLFDRPVNLSGLETLDDGLRFQNYGVTVLTAGERAVIARTILKVVDDDGVVLTDRVDVVVDRPMSRYPSQYRVTVTNVKSESGLGLSSSSLSAQFDGLQDKRVPPSLETAPGLKDFANPQTLADTLDPIPDVSLATLGTLPTDDTGDYAFDEGLAYLRKRVFRRLVVRPGGFYHLPDYGLGIPLRLKELMATPLLRELQEEAQEQVEQEDDVEAVQVDAAREQGLLRLSLRVRAKGKQAKFDFPFRLGEDLVTF